MWLEESDNRWDLLFEGSDVPLQNFNLLIFIFNLVWGI